MNTDIKECSPDYHISILLSSQPPQKQGYLIPAGRRFAVFSSLHSRNVIVMVTSGAWWPWEPLPSNARQWNENEVLVTCMRQISVAPWVLTAGGVRLSLPRAGCWQGQGCKAGRRSGESWSECFKNQNLREQSYCNQKWASEWGEQLDLRRVSCQPVV